MHTARGAASRAVQAPPAVGMWPRSPPAGLALRGLRTQDAEARGAGCHMRVLGATPALSARGVWHVRFFCVPPHARSPAHPFHTTLPQGPLHLIQLPTDPCTDHYCFL